MGNAATVSYDECTSEVEGCLTGWRSSPRGNGLGAEQQEQERETSVEVSSGIRIKGAVGLFSGHINSTFFQTGQMYNKHMLYRSHSTPTCWLRVRIASSCIRDHNFCLANPVTNRQYRVFGSAICIPMIKSRKCTNAVYSRQ